MCTKRSSVAGDGLRRFAVDGYLKGANLSGHERRTIYYRLAVLGHHERWESTFLDAWTEYAPIRRVLTARA